jgi:hypothetical protein
MVDSGLRRVAVEVVDDNVLETPAVIAFSRLVVLGGDAQRIHEEIMSAGGTIIEGRFRRFDTRADLDSVVQASEFGDVPDSVRSRLAGLWPQIEGRVSAALDSRMEERTHTLESRLQRRAEREIADVEAVLSELASQIEQQLAEPTGQLELFEPDERQQMARDKAALEARLAAIPEEITRETQRIRERYTDPDPRSFPFAIVFVVPRSIALGGD